MTVLGQPVPDPDATSLAPSAISQPPPDPFDFSDAADDSVPVQIVVQTPGTRKSSGLGGASLIIAKLAACALLIGLVVLVLGAKGVRPFSLSFWNSIGGATPWGPFPTVPLIAVGVLVLALVMIYGIVWLATGLVRRCPMCGRWWAREYLGQQLIERKECYGLVTRTAHTSTSGSYSGSSTPSASLGSESHHGTTSSSSTTRWKERVPVVRSTYNLHYRCTICNYRWTKRTVEEVEDFNRS
jgi:hypothetical protein